LGRSQVLTFTETQDETVIRDSSSTKTLHFRIEGLDGKTRLDRWLTAQTDDLSRSRIQALIAAGNMKLDGVIVTDPGFVLKANLNDGSAIDLLIPPPVASQHLPEDIKLDVFFEDEFLLILNKPAGMVVHPGAGNPTGTMVNALLAHCGPAFLAVGGVERPGIVHRLDKDTSGLMVVAKNENTLTALQQKFAERDILRAYNAVVTGIPQPSNGEIDAPIGRHPKDRKKMAIEPRLGKEAITGYRLIECFGARASLIECRLKTGRTHQIRVHMHSVGNPLIGDPMYGPKRKSLYPAFGRQALHARELGFTHPDTGKELFFETEPPQDFMDLVTELRGPTE